MQYNLTKDVKKMKKRQLKKIKNQMLNVGINLNKLESLSRILLHCTVSDENLKEWDNENLSSILLEKLIETKQRFNNIEKIMGI
jgi:hypothetical protein